MDQEKSERANVKLNLRLSPQDHQRLKEAAKADCRSLHMEIVHRLRRSLNEPASA
jgi:predicted HicB family RNase H-like nuclease